MKYVRYKFYNAGCKRKKKENRNENFFFFKWSTFLFLPTAIKTFFPYNENISYTPTRFNITRVFLTCSRKSNLLAFYSAHSKINFQLFIHNLINSLTFRQYPYFECPVRKSQVLPFLRFEDRPH